MSFTLGIQDSHPDVINVEESWLHHDIDSHFVTLQDYNLIRYDRQCNNATGQNKRGGGPI